MEAGIQVAQLFDSWAGALSPQQYETFVLPYSRRIFDEMRSLGVPDDFTSVLAPRLCSSSCAVLGVTSSASIGRVNLDEAWSRIGYDRGHSGQTWTRRCCWRRFHVVEDGARDILRRAEGRGGHVF